ncbi:hypothetical protein [Cytobacillus firmus]|uniref:hypothetical protein n=1 Tax=Cytobacillus firmus TaxID=1399 RepID=UPI0022282B0F|nr:hypothetical protein [Cytobacillus firmus]
MSLIDKVSYKRSKAIIAYLNRDAVKAYSLLDEASRTCRQGSSQYGYFHAELKLTEIIRNRMDSQNAQDCKAI